MNFFYKYVYIYIYIQNFNSINAKQSLKKPKIIAVLNILHKLSILFKFFLEEEEERKKNNTQIKYKNTYK